MSNNLFSLESKNILITGASSGIGQKCAVVFSEMGANVILVARRDEKLNEVYNQLSPGKHQKFAFNVTNFDNIENLIEEAVSSCGLLSGFVHCAGIDLTLPLSVTKPKHYVEIFNTNVVAGFEFSKIISKNRYSDKKGCSLIFISSILGVLGQTGKLAYSTSKGALIAGIKSMALELSVKGIRVNAISPAIVETDMVSRLFENIPEDSMESIIKMHPLGLGRTEDIAYACVYLLSDASRWVTGTNLIIDGGYSAK